MMTACEISNLQMHVPNGVGGRRSILDVPELAIAQGQLTAIAGASGSGKTTLLHCLTGIHRPSTGSIQIQGKQLETLSETECDAWRLTHVGLVFQDFKLVSEMTALENVLLPTHFARSAIAPGRADALLASYGIAQHNLRVDRMSRGEQQRVACARALLFNPPLIIADEPTASLDSESARNIITALKNCTRTGQTVIVATHDTKLLAAADFAVTLEHGRVVRPQKKLAV
jgi:putative ABC transport system ATP-binding protein